MANSTGASSIARDLAFGFVPTRMLAGVLINGFWGLGTAIIFAGLRIWALGSSRPTTV